MYSTFIKLVVLLSLLVCCGFTGRVLYSRFFDRVVQGKDPCHSNFRSSDAQFDQATLKYLGEDRDGSGFLSRVTMALEKSNCVYDYVMYIFAFLLFYLAQFWIPITKEQILILFLVMRKKIKETWIQKNRRRWI